jgi:uridine kinase
MNRLVKQDLPLKKYSIHTDEARRIFHEERLYDKERLLRYRTSSNINVYDLDGCLYYFYGYMVPSTGYLKVFDLKLYDEGYMLLFPYRDMKKVAPFEPSQKLFSIQKK